MLAGAGRILAEAGVPDPATDAQLLLAHAWDLDSRGLGRKRLFGESVPAEVASRFAHLIEERRHRIPLQHLTGMAPFRRIELEVGPGVFIPRPETEVLVGEVLDELARIDGRAPSAAAEGTRHVPFVVDLCTGSGAIALSVAHEHPRVRVLGVEREPEALGYARRNLTRILPTAGPESSSRVDIIGGDATRFAEDHPELAGAADIVVTNPPYVPDAAIPRDPEVADHDPAAALYGGASGLEIPALIIAQAVILLAPGGMLALEHAEGQGSRMRSILESTAGLADAVTFPDYTGRDRYTVARRRPAASGGDR